MDEGKEWMRGANDCAHPLVFLLPRSVAPNHTLKQGHGGRVGPLSNGETGGEYDPREDEIIR